MRQYCIALADDHALLRQGLRKIVDGRTDLKVIGDVGDGLALLDLVKKIRPQMVILDISMPRLRGIEAAREVKKRDPATKVLILTMHNDAEYAKQAFAAGADGYLLKENADTELFVAIEKIRQGKRYLSPQLMDLAMEDWTLASQGIRRFSSRPDSLTPREQEVLKLAAEGKASKEIAALLFISARTVDHHLSSIMSKLKVRKRTDLVRYAMQKGYI